MTEWREIKQAGELPAGTGVICDYRINGYVRNGWSGDPYTKSDAIRALLPGANCKVEIMRAGLVSR